MKYAKIVDNNLVYATSAEFRGIPHWETNIAAIRRRGYMPLNGEPEQREGYAATPSSWHVVEQSETRVEPRRENPVTKAPFMEDVMEEDPETHEMKKIGERQVTREVPVEFDTSYIQIDSYDYTEAPAPVEPDQPDTTERDAAEKAIVQAILAAATQYNAVQDIASMQDITIPALKELARQKGMPDTEFDALITKLTPYKWQLEAVEDTTWADCWQGLKSRFAQWMQELATAE
jgi:hypothetical protein